jgi:Leucine-rich repeat (LRR) protein
MKSLEILNMFDNSVQKVDFEQFPKTLKSLNLQYNRLKEIKNIDKLELLESINVERNWL